MTVQDGGGAGPRTLRLDIAGTTLTVTRWGTGAPLLCLHAIGHGARDFARLGQRIGDRHSVVAIDFPGHGESPADGTPPTARHYEALVAGVADALGLTRFALLGNSIGGAAAIRYAAANPERVSSLVICNSGGIQTIGLLARIVCAHYARFFAKGARGAASYPAAFRRYYERTVLPLAPAAWRREEIIADAGKTAALLRDAWTNFARPEADIRALTRALRCPVLYAWAKGDGINAWSRCRKAALAAPDHRVVLFPGGHAPFLETPEAFDAALADFLVPA